MNKRDLDNYITGHYGEDQFREEDDMLNVYEYDPTDDGPEAEVITRILAAHTLVELISESIDYFNWAMGVL